MTTLTIYIALVLCLTGWSLWLTRVQSPARLEPPPAETSLPSPQPLPAAPAYGRPYRRDGIGAGWAYPHMQPPPPAPLVHPRH